MLECSENGKSPPEMWQFGDKNRKFTLLRPNEFGVRNSLVYAIRFQQP